MSFFTNKRSISLTGESYFSPSPWVYLNGDYPATIIYEAWNFPGRLTGVADIEVIHLQSIAIITPSIIKATEANIHIIFIIIIIVIVGLTVGRHALKQKCHVDEICSTDCTDSC